MRSPSDTFTVANKFSKYANIPVHNFLLRNNFHAQKIYLTKVIFFTLSSYASFFKSEFVCFINI
jgi:hypothetical protein